MLITTVAEQDGSVMLGARQCFPASGGTVYHYAVEISVPDEEGMRAAFQVITYDNPACTGAVLDTVNSSYIEGAHWNLTELTYLTPSKAKSMALRLVSIKPFRLDPVPVLFDSIRSVSCVADGCRACG